MAAGTRGTKQTAGWEHTRTHDAEICLMIRPFENENNESTLQSVIHLCSVSEDIRKEQKKKRATREEHTHENNIDRH